MQSSKDVFLIRFFDPCGKKWGQWRVQCASTLEDYSRPSHMPGLDRQIARFDYRLFGSLSVNEYDDISKYIGGLNLGLAHQIAEYSSNIQNMPSKEAVAVISKGWCRLINKKEYFATPSWEKASTPYQTTTNSHGWRRRVEEKAEHMGLRISGWYDLRTPKEKEQYPPE